MSKRVYKYNIPIADRTIVRVPESAEFLHIAEQFGDLYMWCVVDTEDYDVMEMELFIRGTGHDFTGDEDIHVDTVLMSNGLVWHIFA